MEEVFWFPQFCFGFLNFELDYFTELFEDLLRVLVDHDRAVFPVQDTLATRRNLRI